MIKRPRAIGIEINPKLVGVLLTEKMGGTLRLFCYYVSAEISQFDVPAEENEGNLQSLLASLNLEGTCTSLILDEVVQGRIYIQADNQYWLYTLLKSTVDTLPPMNADIGELPWLVIWRSQEAEVIQYGQIGDPEHCFALRSHVSETTAVRLMKHSKAFLNPVSVPRIKTYRRPYLKIAVAVLTAGALLVAALTCFLKVKNNSASQQEPSAQIMAPVSTNATCYLLFKHQISGPYPANVVEVMNGGGLLSPDTLWRADKSSDWVKLSELPKFPPIK